MCRAWPASSPGPGSPLPSQSRPTRTWSPASSITAGIRPSSTGSTVEVSSSLDLGGAGCPGNTAGVSPGSTGSRVGVRPGSTGGVPSRLALTRSAGWGSGRGGGNPAGTPTAGSPTAGWAAGAVSPMAWSGEADQPSHQPQSEVWRRPMSAFPAPGMTTILDDENSVGSSDRGSSKRTSQRSRAEESDRAEGSGQRAMGNEWGAQEGRQGLGLAGSGEEQSGAQGAVSLPQLPTSADSNWNAPASPTRSHSPPTPITLAPSAGHTPSGSGGASCFPALLFSVHDKSNLIVTLQSR